MSRLQRGFTLIELMIVVAVLAILFGVALPAWSGFLEAGRAGAAKAALLSSLTTSVNRAAVTGSHAVLCSSVDRATCSGDLDWTSGWVAFLDRNGNRQRDADEALITAEGPLGGKVTLQTTSGRTRLVLQPNGGNAGSNVTFTLCDGRGPSRAQTLVINNRGGMRYGTPSAKAVASACRG